jgi:hypothetical protein
MKTVVRLYIQKGGKEVCVKEEKEMIKILSNPKEEIDLDYHDARGFAKIGTSKDLIGQTVIIGDSELEIPNH